MAKKDLEEIKKLTKTDKLVIGKKEATRQLQEGKLAKVMLSSNCTAFDEEQLSHYAKIANVPIIKLEIPNDELGVLCKKQYSISILGIAK